MVTGDLTRVDIELQDLIDAVSSQVHSPLWLRARYEVRVTTSRLIRIYFPLPFSDDVIASAKKLEKLLFGQMAPLRGSIAVLGEHLPGPVGCTKRNADEGR